MCMCMCVYLRVRLCACRACRAVHPQQLSNALPLFNSTIGPALAAAAAQVLERVLYPSHVLAALSSGAPLLSYHLLMRLEDPAGEAWHAAEAVQIVGWNGADLQYSDVVALDSGRMSNDLEVDGQYVRHVQRNDRAARDAAAAEAAEAAAAASLPPPARAWVGGWVGAGGGEGWGSGSGGGCKRARYVAGGVVCLWVEEGA